VGQRQRFIRGTPSRLHWIWSVLLVLAGFWVVVAAEGVSNPIELSITACGIVIAAAPWWIPMVARNTARLRADYRSQIGLALYVLGVVIALFGLATVFFAPPIVLVGVLVVVCGRRMRRSLNVPARHPKGATDPDEEYRTH